jgi:hypothetical protein
MGQPATGCSEFQTPPVPIGLHSFQTPNPVRPTGEGRLASREAPVNFGLPVARLRPEVRNEQKEQVHVERNLYIQYAA